MMPRENTRRASYMQGKQRTHTFRRKSTKKFPTAHAIPAFYFVLSLTRTRISFSHAKLHKVGILLRVCTFSQYRILTLHRYDVLSSPCQCSLPRAGEGKVYGYTC